MLELYLMELIHVMSIMKETKHRYTEGKQRN